MTGWWVVRRGGWTVWGGEVGGGAYSGFSRTTCSNFWALPAALRKPGEARW